MLQITFRKQGQKKSFIVARHKPTSASHSSQILALTAAKKSNPNGRWWVKADGTDMKMGLLESVKNEWSGDCDLGDGSLQVRIEEYHNRLGQLMQSDVFP